MKTESIKLELIEWLTQLEDKNILTSLLQFKKSNESGDWSDNLTESQVDSLQRGLMDMKNKKVLSSNEFWNSHGRKV